MLLVGNVMIRIDFTDLGIENIVVVSDSSFFQDYSSDSRV